MKCMADVTMHFHKTYSGMSVRMTSKTFPYLCDGIKSVHSTASDYEMHKLHDAFSYSKHKLKVRTYSTALDYEMHELYDAFSYSNNNFALNDLILILSPVISV